jgi:hypothetical protein
MQTTGTNKKVVNRESLGNRKANAVKALTSYEAKSTRRNPAYLIYGFAMSFLWPVLMILPTLMRNSDITSNIGSALDTGAAIICAMCLGVLASCFSCGFNILAVSAFSREGSTFSALKALPIDFGDYYRSKRNFAMLICSLGSVLYIIIIGIVSVVMGVISLVNSWVILYAAGISFLLNLILTNLLLLKNSRKPNFDWDSETEFSRKLSWINIVALVVGIFPLVTLFIVIVFSLHSKSAEVDFLTIPAIIAALLLAAATVAAAILVNRFAVKKAEENLQNFE